MQTESLFFIFSFSHLFYTSFKLLHPPHPPSPFLLATTTPPDLLFYPCSHSPFSHHSAGPITPLLHLNLTFSGELKVSAHSNNGCVSPPPPLALPPARFPPASFWLFHTRSLFLPLPAKKEPFQCMQPTFTPCYPPFTQ